MSALQISVLIVGSILWTATMVWLLSAAAGRLRQRSEDAP